MVVNSKWLCDKTLDKIVWCSGSDQPKLFAWLRERVPNIIILDYFPSRKIENKSLFNPNKNNLCVTDDLMEVCLQKLYSSQKKFISRKQPEIQFLEKCSQNTLVIWILIFFVFIKICTTLPVRVGEREREHIYFFVF